VVQFRANIFIGGYNDVKHPYALLNDGITAVLNVAYEINDDTLPPTEIRNVKVALMDNVENSPYMKRLAVDAMKTMIMEKEKILVHCAAGLSRSVFTAVAAVAELENKDTHDVFDELRKVHPFAMYGPLFAGWSDYNEKIAAQFGQVEA
jgi:protein-tyrosine phosphatase